VFRDAEFRFAKGINVVIGSNGAGKSHLLKLAYTAARWSQEVAEKERGNGRIDKATLQKTLGQKLVAVFHSEGLGRLTSRGGVRGTDIKATFYDRPKATLQFRFNTRSKTDAILSRPPVEYFGDETVYFPTKEMLSMFPGFSEFYLKWHLSVSETYYDLSRALSKPLPRGPKAGEVRPLLATIEEILGGSIELENGRFYLTQQRGGHFEIPLVAEGFRKLGTVAYLLANGTLARQSILFWDEPETNLNPAYLAKLARLLVEIARNETQVFIATHSLFVMRELSILLGNPENRGVERRFFALALNEDNSGATVTSGDTAEKIEPIAALDAELDQSGRYMESRNQAPPPSL
jgi:energy-coupling factor transporter ATP-binding protein EcfA2